MIRATDTSADGGNADTDVLGLSVTVSVIGEGVETAVVNGVLRYDLFRMFHFLNRFLYICSLV